MKNKFVILLSITIVLSLLILSAQTEDQQPTKIILNLYTGPTPYNASSLSQMESSPTYPYTEIVTVTDLQTVAKVGIQKQKDNVLQIPEGRYFIRVWWSERRMSEYVNDKTGYSLDSSNSSVTMEYYSSGVICLADTPKRVEPNYQIPLMAQMHNPATTTLYYIWIYDNYTGQLKDTKNVSISTNWHTIYYYNRNTFSLSGNWASIKVILAQWDYVNYYWVYEYSYMNVYVSNYYLPKLSYWYAGDQHVHSEYTDDIYEFGIPIDAITTGGRYFGLNYTIVTDHGYDVWDDWTTLGSKVGNYSGFWLIRGEEVSCDSNPWSADDAGHLLAFGTDNFIDTGHGSYYAFNPTKDENTVLYELTGYSNSFGYIAHPFDSSWPHSWPWRFDLMDEIYWENPVKGLEIINGARDSDDNTTIDYWISLLLKGKKIFAIANSDAHDLNALGNYGSSENFRTYVYTTSLSKDNILSALRNGNSIITSGPLLTFTANNAKIGSSISVSQNGNVSLNVQGAVTPEFSNDNYIYVWAYYGTTDGIWSYEGIQYLGAFYAYSSGSLNTSFNVSNLGNKSGYIRLEGYSYKDGNYYYAFTNPVWVNVVAQTLYVPYVVDTAAFRTNIAIGNYGASPANATVYFYNPNGTLNAQKNIPPVPSHGYTQLNDVIRWVRNLGETSSTNLSGYLKIETDSTNVYVVGSQADNVSNDPSATLGKTSSQAFTNGLIPVVLNIGSSWNSFVVIDNLGAISTNVTLTFYRYDAGYTKTYTVNNLASGGQWKADDIGALSVMNLPDGYYGMLKISNSNNQPLLASVRGYTGQNTGAYLDGVPLSSGATELYIPYVVDTTDQRTNVAVGNIGSGNANVTLTFYDQYGNANASRGDTVAQNAYKQWGNVIRWIRNLGETTPTGLQGYIKIESNQPIYAVGSQNDNSSNDPSATLGKTYSQAFTNGIIPVVLNLDLSNPPWNSFIAIDNMSTWGSAWVNLYAYNFDGSPSNSTSFNLCYRCQWSGNIDILFWLPDGFYGMLVISSDQPVLASVRGYSGNYGAYLSGFGVM